MLQMGLSVRRVWVAWTNLQSGAWLRRRRFGPHSWAMHAASRFVARCAARGAPPPRGSSPSLLAEPDRSSESAGAAPHVPAPASASCVQAAWCPGGWSRRWGHSRSAAAGSDQEASASRHHPLPVTARAQSAPTETPSSQAQGRRRR
eukprot:scaffold3952_cov116-Isochrysis_galbana.AAC.4